MITLSKQQLKDLRIAVDYAAFQLYNIAYPNQTQKKRFNMLDETLDIFDGKGKLKEFDRPHFNAMLYAIDKAIFDLGTDYWNRSTDTHKMKHSSQVNFAKRLKNIQKMIKGRRAVKVKG